MSLTLPSVNSWTWVKILDVRHYTVNKPSGDFSIPVTDQEADPGEFFENNLLKFANHVSQYVRKANNILAIGVIKHSFCNLDPHIFRLLYISLVRPILVLYGIPICWRILGLWSLWRGMPPDWCQCSNVIMIVWYHWTYHHFKTDVSIWIW